VHQTLKKTKIVATLGPTSDSPEKIEELIKAGVNVFRFNMKHADISWHNERIIRVQGIADTLKVPIGILIDLQGPEIRINTPQEKPVQVKEHEQLLFSSKEIQDTPHIIIPHPEVFKSLDVGDGFLIDDGFVEFEVIKKVKDGFLAEAKDSATIKHRKGLNLVGKDIDLPSLIDDDLKKLDMAARAKVDFVALSFARKRQDIQILREEMKKRNLNAMIVAKIESQAGLDHLDELIDESDAIMVARGDLGIEVPIEQLAYWQKTIIIKCRQAFKPVITATQMLDSMINNPRPTRAEATDVANAVFDGTDAVMLSAETASGQYPVKAVTAMARIAHFNEVRSHIMHQIEPHKNLTASIVDASLSILSDSKQFPINAIVVFTETGYTARVLSSHRPKVPVIAVTDQQKTVEELTLSYGVHAIPIQFPEGTFSISKKILDDLVQKNVLHSGDTVLVTHGKSWRTPGLTNALMVITLE